MTNKQKINVLKMHGIEPLIKGEPNTSLYFKEIYVFDYNVNKVINITNWSDNKLKKWLGY